MIINRRAFISATVALAVGGTGAVQGAETGPRMATLRVTWTGDRPTFVRVPYASLPTHPWRFVQVVGDGMAVVMEEV